MHAPAATLHTTLGAVRPHSSRCDSNPRCPDLKPRTCFLRLTSPAVYTIYLWAVRPYSVALVGGFELAGALATISMCGLAMSVMDGRGSSDLTR